MRIVTWSAAFLCQWQCWAVSSARLRVAVAPHDIIGGPSKTNPLGFPVYMPPFRHFGDSERLLLIVHDGCALLSTRVLEYQKRANSSRLRELQIWK